MMRKAAQPSKAWTEKSSADGRLRSARLALRKIGPRDPRYVRAASDFPDNLGKMFEPRPFSAYSPIEAKAFTLLDNNQVVLAHISGKMRKRFVHLNLGDRVKLEMSPYGLSKARIVYRLG